MRQYRQFQSLIVDDFEAVQWTHPVHKHNHFELIFIKEGTGIHYISQNATAYNSGDFFLLGPDDDHYFKIEERTRFVFLKFTGVYVHQFTSAHGVRHLEYLIKSRETHHSGFSLSCEDRKTAEHIIDVILSLKNNLLSNEHLIWSQLLSMASLLQRNMPELKESSNSGSDTQALFCYIHKNIYTPSKLKAKVMANHFNTSLDYIGPYFKRNAGITLREYVGNYRNTLIRQRIASGNYSLKQIAAEFGMTDESHVSKAASLYNRFSKTK